MAVLTNTTISRSESRPLGSRPQKRSLGSPPENTVFEILAYDRLTGLPLLAVLPDSHMGM